MKKIITILIMLIVSAAYIEAYAESFEGTVKFSKRLEMGFLASGVIKKINVVHGQKVNRGYKLIELEGTPFLAAVSQAQANLKLRETDLTEMSRNYKQAQELYDHTVLSTIDLENSKLELDRANANVDIASAQLTKAKYELKQSSIKAPFDGLIVKIKANIGQRIVSTLEAKPLIIFSAIDEYIIRILAPISTTLTIGQSASVTILGKKFNGHVESISLEPIEDTPSNKPKLYEININFKAKELFIQSGQLAKVELELGD